MRRLVLRYEAQHEQLTVCCSLIICTLLGVAALNHNLQKSNF
jgi:hypothetical protein